MDIKSFDLRSRLAADAGENSIMQTITIAVSAILIAAGLVTAPGLINNARDNNARTDLANVSFAQEFTLANTGNYADSFAEIEASAALAVANDGSGPVLTRSGGVDLFISATASPDAYVMYAVSSSGNVFKRVSGTAETIFVATLDSGTIAGEDAVFVQAGAGVAGDVTALNAITNDVDPLVVGDYWNE